MMPTNCPLFRDDPVRIIARKKLKKLKSLQKNLFLGGNMRPKNSESEGQQLELGATLLESFINLKDELVLFLVKL